MGNGWDGMRSVVEFRTDLFVLVIHIKNGVPSDDNVFNEKYQEALRTRLIDNLELLRCNHSRY